ncbi:hypothetical protein LXL04_021203 [Taraxacum kok-saghyz]
MYVYQQAPQPKHDEAEEDDDDDDDEKPNSPKDNTEKIVKATRPQGRYKRSERGKHVAKAEVIQESEAVFYHGELELVDASDKLEAQDEYEIIISPYWWGNKFGFVSGGLLGAQMHNPRERSLTRHQKSLKILTKGLRFMNKIKKIFTILYKIKQLLENKDRPRKVAGVRFQGTKMSFSDSEREEYESKEDIPLKKQKIDNVSESKVKLKKLCKKLLSQVIFLRLCTDKSLKLKKLKVLIDENSSIFSNFSSKKDALEILKQKLERSKKFTVEGKKVSLSSK